MALLLLVLVSGALYFVLNFLVLSRAKKKLEEGKLRLAGAALIPVIEYGTTIVGVAALVYAFLAVLFILLSLGGRTDVALAANLLNGVHEFSESAERYRKGWDYIFLVFLLIANGIIIYRQAQQRRRKAFADFVEEQARNLKAGNSAATWEQLPPTEAMEEIARQVISASSVLNDPANTAKLTPEQSDQLKKGIEEGQRRYLLLDMERRFDRPHVAPAAPGGAQKRFTFGELLTSRGALTLFKGTAHLLMLISMVVTIASTVAIAAAGGLRAGLPATRSALESVRVARVYKESEDFLKELDAARQDNSNNNNLSATQQAAINTIAKAYEISYASSQPWNVHSDSAKGDYVRRKVVRENILASGLRNATAPGAEAESSVHNDTLTPEEQAEFDLYTASDLNDGPLSKIGQEFKNRLTKLAAIHEGIRNSLVSFAASFHEQAPGDFHRSLVTQISSIALGFGDKSNSDLISKLVNDARSDVGADVIGKVDDVFQATYFRELIKTGSFNSADEKMRHYPAQYVATTSKREQASKWAATILPNQDVPADLAVHPPRYAVKPENVAAVQRADVELAQIYKELTANADLSAKEKEVTADGFLDPVHGFGDYFPAQIGDESRTDAGKTKKALLGGPDLPPINPRGDDGLASHISPTTFGPPSGGGAGGAAQEPFLTSFERAGSFELLEGFSRIGGVLIGIDSPNIKPGVSPSFRDIDWQPQGNRTKITLHRDDGREFSFVFRTSILQQALLYASDGRPVATTMTTAFPLQELKVQVHPALLDTPVGCRAVELDRLVDESSETGELSEQRKQARRRVDEQVLIYDFAYITRKSLLEQKMKDLSQIFTDREAQVDGALQALQQLKGVLPKVYSDVGDFGDPLQSLPAAKREFYDATLVDLIAKCMKSSNGPDAVTECIQNGVQQQVATAEDGSEAAAHLWRVDPPTYETWSGLRELPFTVDENLSFMQSEASGTSNSLWPFDFLIQVAFTSTPSYGEGSGDNHDREADLNPWTFTSIHGTVLNAVQKHLVSDPEQAAYFADMKEFALAQRLVRVLLNGELGADFPVEKLVQLTTDTKYSVPAGSRTPRWNPHPEAMVDELKTLLLRAHIGAIFTGQSDAASAIEACLTRIEAYPKDHNVGSSTEGLIRTEIKMEQALSCDLSGQWKTAQDSCEASASLSGSKDRLKCGVANAFAAADVQSRLMGLKNTLGIADEEVAALNRKDNKQATCQPIP
ncbi:hypothetical protein [Silvibacterium acidisoli]|uniref:hypothetical protein n=1 Tax=Acidobacteriaceae bacterium ZG23-2 TaxID=2883246 RepID=UPI00406D12B1